MVKRLVIKVSNDYDSKFEYIPVNTLVPVSIESEIGKFELIINIKNFDGSQFHRANSLYNLGDDKYLDGKDFADSRNEYLQANLSFEVNFQPKFPIKGDELIFGNEFTTSLKEYVPTSLLSSGLKIFNWFINNTVKGDIYNQNPYLYGPILNSCTYMSITDQIPFKYSTVDSSKQKLPENLNENTDNIVKIPCLSLDRKKFFNKLSNCENFVFLDSSVYKLKFDTNLIKLQDSNYAVSLPTYKNKTLDINVSKYADDKLNNFNWIIKCGGYDGVGSGKIGLVVNFALIDEL